MREFIKRLKLSHDVKAHIFLGMLAFVVSCNDSVKLGKELITDWPDPGFEMFTTPREFDNPGTVFGKSKNGERNTIDTLRIQATPQDESFPSVKIIEEQTVGLKTLVKFIINGKEDAGLDVAATDEGAVKVTLEINDAKRLRLTDREIQEPILNNINPDKNIFTYNSYHIIKEVVSAKSIKYKFEKKDLDKYELNTKLSKYFEGKAGYSWISSREYQLEQTFSKPMNIFFHSKEIDQNRLKELLKQKGLDVSENTLKIVDDTDYKASFYVINYSAKKFNWYCKNLPMDFIITPNKGEIEPNKISDSVMVYPNPKNILNKRGNFPPECSFSVCNGEESKVIKIITDIRVFNDTLAQNLNSEMAIEMAKAKFSSLLQKDKRSAFNFNAGMLLSANQYYREANQLFEQVDYTDPSFANKSSFLYPAFVSYRENGDREKAYSYLKKLTSETPQEIVNIKKAYEHLPQGNLDAEKQKKTIIERLEDKGHSLENEIVELWINDISYKIKKFTGRSIDGYDKPLYIHSYCTGGTRIQKLFKGDEPTPIVSTNIYSPYNILEVTVPPENEFHVTHIELDNKPFCTGKNMYDFYFFTTLLRFKQLKKLRFTFFVHKDRAKAMGKPWIIGLKLNEEKSIYEPDVITNVIVDDLRQDFGNQSFQENFLATLNLLRRTFPEDKTLPTINIDDFEGFHVDLIPGLPFAFAFPCPDSKNLSEKTVATYTP